MGWGTSLWMNWKQKKRRDRSHAKSSPFRELFANTVLWELCYIHIPGIYYNNRNWKHVLRAFRVWSMVSLVLVPPCTAGAVLLERATGWQVWGAVLVVYIASLFGAIVIPAKRFE